MSTRYRGFAVPPKGTLFRGATVHPDAVAFTLAGGFNLANPLKPKLVTVNAHSPHELRELAVQLIVLAAMMDRNEPHEADCSCSDCAEQRAAETEYLVRSAEQSYQETVGGPSPEQASGRES